MITIIYAHPNRDSFNGSILDSVKLVLDKINAEYNIIDLNKERFDPIMHADELYTKKPYKTGKQARKYQKIISDSDRLIFIYPSWWNNMPAILKGFIDKVFVREFAFIFKKGLPVGLLKGKKALVITTTGAPSFVSRFLRGRRNIKSLTMDILGFCGIKSKSIQIGKVTPSNKMLKEELMKVKLAVLNFTRE
jgi:NAD(P)H dehydrogenase (quinone)